MSRISNDQFDAQGVLVNGFDYNNQAWVEDGKYVRCGHPESMHCGCYGRRFEGLTPAQVKTLSPGLDSAYRVR